MAAAAIFEVIEAFFHYDARVRARYAAIADDEVALGLAADMERHRLDGYANAVAARIGDDQRCGFYTLRGGGIGVHMVTSALYGLAARASPVPPAVRATPLPHVRAMPDSGRNSRQLRCAPAGFENRNGSRSA